MYLHLTLYFNIITSIGNYNSDTPYKFTKNMTYNFRAEFDNFPKSWKIYGSTSKTFTMTNDGLTNATLLAEHTCINRQLDSDGFINDGPFYYTNLSNTNQIFIGYIFKLLMYGILLLISIYLDFIHR